MLLNLLISHMVEYGLRWYVLLYKFLVLIVFKSKIGTLTNVQYTNACESGICAYLNIIRLNKIGSIIKP